MKILTLLIVSLTLASATIRLPQSFHAHFKQTITNPKKKVITYTGRVRFSDSMLFKWLYRTPTQKEVCSDGYELIVVDHDLEQVSNYLIDKGFDLGKILRHAKRHAPSIYIADYENRHYTIKLNANEQLESVAYFDDLDNKVQILFWGMQYGRKNLPAKSMRCEAPRDYDRIRG